MLSNLLLGVTTMTLCLVLQLALITRALMYYAGKHSRLDHASFLGTLGILNGVMFLLMSGKFMPDSNLGWAFSATGGVQHLQRGVLSLCRQLLYARYGDIVMSEKRRLLGPLQAINGILMVGVTTAAFMTTLRDALTHSNRSWAGGKQGTALLGASDAAPVDPASD